jgi:hypothetical protein
MTLALTRRKEKVKARRVKNDEELITSSKQNEQ